MSKINIGDKFGKLTVITEPYRKPDAPKGNNQKYVLATCECGTKDKQYNIYMLLKGNCNSCGCLRKELVGNCFRTHGLRSHLLYNVWVGMRQRCYNKNNDEYHNYGGRGIIVCGEWREDFQTFYTFGINNGWQKGLVIDRINNDGNYEPSNCRFVDDEGSAQNKRTTKLTPEIVKEIRRIYKEPNPPSHTITGKKYGVGKYAIWAIVNNRTWKNILPD